jgi:glycosyltransferase involved in cell wall biosynthesis
MIPTNVQQLVKSLKRAGLKLVVNQDGLYYPAWYGPGWERQNETLRRLHDSADFVIYQSEFCAKSVEHFFGRRAPASTILLNPVDLKAYVNIAQRGDNPKLFTLAGSKDRSYRLKLAVSVLAMVIKTLPGASLSIAGYGSNPEARAMKRRILGWCDELGVGQDKIKFPPPFTRTQAPTVIAQCNILLHTALNDPCPNIVCEALACGLPPVYIASGGVPELVGPDVGESVPAALSWEKLTTPAPQPLASAVVNVWDNWERHHVSARARAESVLGLEKFVSAHEQIFTRLITNN